MYVVYDKIYIFLKYIIDSAGVTLLKVYWFLIPSFVTDYNYRRVNFNK